MIIKKIITRGASYTILINNKAVYKDTNGNWIALSELTTNETTALKQHLESIGELSC